MVKNNDKNISLWTPLIGFNRDDKDRGVSDYLKHIDFKVNVMSLFVFNADIINLHVENMPQEIIFPEDYCNYYGNRSNEIRNIQPWTNYNLKELACQLNSRGIETYLGIMGMHFPGQIGNVGYSAKQDFVDNHKELMVESTYGSECVNILKRFKDGKYFEDHFIEKTVQALKDYQVTGIHLSDGFCPLGPQLQLGDYSDDMIEQFTIETGIILPQSIGSPLNSSENLGIKARATFIWNRYRKEWIEFYCRRWFRFFKKLCDALHKYGKKVMVNNANTCEPFEAIYRYGVDYKLLEKAGVDIIVLEDQATAIYAGDTSKENRYRIHEYMNMPSFMKAYTPDIKHLGINSAKDSTEEYSSIIHLPCTDEREIYSLSDKLYYGENSAERAIEGFFVCLADALYDYDWQWLAKRYKTVFEETAVRSLSPVLVWSDNMVSAFLSEYILTKRWSSHKIVSELSREGGCLGGAVRSENLNNIRGAVFVPNIDLLSETEKNEIAGYKGGPIIFTSIASKKFVLGGMEPDIYFEDNSISRDDYRMCFGAYNTGYIDYDSVTKPLGEADLTIDISGEPRYIKDPTFWLTDLIFRKASKGFIQAGAALIHELTDSHVKSELNDLLTQYKMANGKIRLVAENDEFLKYKNITVKTRKPIKTITNVSGFPVQPLKRLLPDGGVIAGNSKEEALLKKATGFIIKIPPAGISVIDVELDD